MTMAKVDSDCHVIEILYIYYYWAIRKLLNIFLQFIDVLSLKSLFC